MDKSHIHPDFDHPWCHMILTSPSITITEIPTTAGRPPDMSPDVSNSMFLTTLYSPSSNAIRAQINFRRSTSEADAVTDTEYCYLMSLGDGLDGKRGRAHGGISSLVLDQMTGTTAAMVSGSTAPATATMTVDYKAPVDTPGVVLCRGWVVERSGRKTWVRAQIEDGEGRCLASAKALFISPREGKI